VLDELNIMLMLFNDQRKVLKAMHRDLKEVDEDGENSRTAASVTTKSGVSTVSSIVAIESDASGRAPRRRQRAQDLSDSDDDSSDVNSEEEDLNSTSRPDAPKKSIWGNLSTPDSFSLPLAMVDANITEISGMISRAEKASRDVSLSH
jgi:hypothetical protein